MNPMSLSSRVYIAGHTGLAGSALTRLLRGRGYHNLLQATRRDVDLRDQAAVDRWFALHRPEYVFLAAGTVGGILANATRPAEFIFDNLMILSNIVNAAFRHEVRRLLCLGSSCIYPRDCLQPIRETDLLSGPLEKTNEAYAVAKIAGLTMCSAYRRQYGCDFFSVMPTNLYGPGDNFDPQMSHVLPGLMRRFHDARRAGQREVTVWGTGQAPAGIPACRRSCGSLSAPDELLRRRVAGERGHGRGSGNQRAGRTHPLDRSSVLRDSL